MGASRDARSNSVKDQVKNAIDRVAEITDGLIEVEPLPRAEAPAGDTPVHVWREPEERARVAPLPSSQPDSPPE